MDVIRNFFYSTISMGSISVTHSTSSTAPPEFGVPSGSLQLKYPTGSNKPTHTSIPSYNKSSLCSNIMDFIKSLSELSIQEMGSNAWHLSTAFALLRLLARARFALEKRKTTIRMKYRNSAVSSAGLFRYLGKTPKRLLRLAKNRTVSKNPEDVEQHSKARQDSAISLSLIRIPNSNNLAIPTHSPLQPSSDLILYKSRSNQPLASGVNAYMQSAIQNLFRQVLPTSTPSTSVADLKRYFILRKLQETYQIQHGYRLLTPPDSQSASPGATSPRCQCFGSDCVCVGIIQPLESTQDLGDEYPVTAAQPVEQEPLLVCDRNPDVLFDFGGDSNLAVSGASSGSSSDYMSVPEGESPLKSVDDIIIDTTQDYDAASSDPTKPESRSDSPNVIVPSRVWQYRNPETRDDEPDLATIPELSRDQSVSSSNDEINIENIAASSGPCSESQNLSVPPLGWQYWHFDTEEDEPKITAAVDPAPAADPTVHSHTRSSRVAAAPSPSHVSVTLLQTPWVERPTKSGSNNLKYKREISATQSRSRTVPYHTYDDCCIEKPLEPLAQDVSTSSLSGSHTVPRVRSASENERSSRRIEKMIQYPLCEASIEELNNFYESYGGDATLIWDGYPFTWEMLAAIKEKIAFSFHPSSLSEDSEVTWTYAPRQKVDQKQRHEASRDSGIHVASPPQKTLDRAEIDEKFASRQALQVITDEYKDFVAGFGGEGTRILDDKETQTIRQEFEDLKRDFLSDLRHMRFIAYGKQSAEPTPQNKRPAKRPVASRKRNAESLTRENRTVKRTAIEELQAPYLPIEAFLGRYDDRGTYRLYRREADQWIAGREMSPRELDDCQAEACICLGDAEKRLIYDEVAFVKIDGRWRCRNEVDPVQYPEYLGFFTWISTDLAALRQQQQQQSQYYSLAPAVPSWYAPPRLQYQYQPAQSSVALVQADNEMPVAFLPNLSTEREEVIQDATRYASGLPALAQPLPPIPAQRATHREFGVPQAFNGNTTSVPEPAERRNISMDQHQSMLKTQPTMDDPFVSNKPRTAWVDPTDTTRPFAYRIAHLAAGQRDPLQGFEYRQDLEPRSEPKHNYRTTARNQHPHRVGVLFPDFYSQDLLLKPYAPKGTRYERYEGRKQFGSPTLGPARHAALTNRPIYPLKAEMGRMNAVRRQRRGLVYQHDRNAPVTTPPWDEDYNWISGRPRELDGVVVDPRCRTPVHLTGWYMQG